MYKKLISSILVFALLNLLGCYSSELVNVTEYKQIEEEDKPDNIRVITIYSEYYLSDFYIENDTLYAKGKEILYNKEKPFDGKIALSDIESIEVESLNSLNTILFGVGIVAIAFVAFLLFVFIYCSASGDCFNIK